MFVIEKTRVKPILLLNVIGVDGYWKDGRFVEECRPFIILADKYGRQK